LSNPIVLLAEDHVDTREMYAEALNSAGFGTVEATNAENALARAATIRLAAVITDLRLGHGADGLELCEKLREDPTTKDIPVIVVTGWIADKKMRARADAAKCAAVLLKPVSPDVLVTVVLKVLQSQPTNG